MPGSTSRSRTLALAFATGVALAGAGLGADTAMAQGKGKKQAQANSPAFQAAAAPLQQKIDAASALQDKARGGDAAAKAQIAATLTGAPAMLAQAVAAASTPMDKLLGGQLALNLGILTNDSAMAERGIRAMLATKLLNPEQTAVMQKNLAQLTSTPQADPVGVAFENQVKTNPRGALADLRRTLDARTGAQPAPAAYFSRATQVAVLNKLPEEALYWSARQVELYPSNVNWLAATQTVRQFVNLDPQGLLDLFRLMSRSGALNNDVRFTASEYGKYADMANLRGAYGEAVKVIDQGVAAGALTTGDTAQMRSSAAAKAASDRASLPGLERQARAAASGVSALATGDLFLGGNEPAKAEELYTVALQKGSIDKDRALTRLGIAQFDQGKYAQARDSFSKVGGARSSLARLWLALVNQRARGGA